MNWPCSNEDHVAAAEWPSGVTRPKPVIAGKGCTARDAVRTAFTIVRFPPACRGLFICIGRFSHPDHAVGETTGALPTASRSYRIGMRCLPVWETLLRRGFSIVGSTPPPWYAR